MAKEEGRKEPGGSGDGGIWGSLRERRESIVSVREEVTRRRGPLGRAVDRIGALLATPAFFLTLLGLHLAWVVLNLPVMPWQPWDAYPFTFLATVASAEAPFLALVILMRQQQDRHVDEVREEVQVQVSLLIERECTTVLRFLDKMKETLDLDIEIEDMERFEQDMDSERLLDDLEERLDDVDPEPTGDKRAERDGPR